MTREEKAFKEQLLHYIIFSGSRNVTVVEYILFL